MHDQDRGHYPKDWAGLLWLAQVWTVDHDLVTMSRRDRRAPVGMKKLLIGIAPADTWRRPSRHGRFKIVRRERREEALM